MFLLRLRRCTLATVPPWLQAAALFKRTFFFAWDTPGTSIFHTTNNWISLNLRSTTGIIPRAKTEGNLRRRYRHGARGGWSLLLELNIPLQHSGGSAYTTPTHALHIRRRCEKKKKTSSEDQYCKKRRNISTPLEKIEEGGMERCRRIQPGNKNPSEKCRKVEKSDEPAPNLTGLKRQTLPVRVCRIDHTQTSVFDNPLQLFPGCSFSTKTGLIPFPPSRYLSLIG